MLACFLLCLLGQRQRPLSAVHARRRTRLLGAARHRLSGAAAARVAADRLVAARDPAVRDRRDLRRQRRQRLGRPDRPARLRGRGRAALPRRVPALDLRARARPQPIGSAAAVDAYLAGVGHEVAARFDARQSDFRLQQGGAPAEPPAAQDFWAARSLGAGSQTLSWSPRNGSWKIVVMNADGSAGIRADLAIGARFLNLLWIGVGALAGGMLLLLLGGAGIWAAAIRRRGGAS
jgi:hypothetical protein